jgi:hypothetical protein
MGGRAGGGLPSTSGASCGTFVATTKRKARLIQRTKIVLLAEDDLQNIEIAKRVGVSVPLVRWWRRRYAAFGLAGIEKDAPRLGRKPYWDQAGAPFRAAMIGKLGYRSAYRDDATILRFPACSIISRRFPSIETRRKPWKRPRMIRTGSSDGPTATENRRASTLFACTSGRGTVPRSPL